MTRNKTLTLDHEIAARIEPFNDGRQVRALFDGHTVKNDRGDGRYVVESGTSGNEYRVSLATGECECPDAEGHRICKHQFAAMYATGCAVLPEAVLDADSLAVDAIVDDETDVHNLDLVDHYESINLSTDDSINATPRWATDSGQIVETVTASEPEPAADEPADIAAERALVSENSQQPATDGGHVCGSTETTTGEPCQRPVTDSGSLCHLHDPVDNGSAQEANTEREIEASETADVSEAFAHATDGGAVEIENADGDTDVFAAVLEQLGDSRPIVVIVTN